MKQGQIKYPPLINEQALYVGGMRDITNAYMNELKPEYKRGNLNVNQLGCQCEMIVQYYFWSKGLAYESDQMLGGKPIASYDIEIKGMQIDVKAVRSFLTELRVNYEAHQKDKEVSHYMFVQPISDNLFNDTANYWLFTKDEISQWQVKELKYTKAYIKLL